MAGNWRGSRYFLLDYKDEAANSNKFYEAIIVEPQDGLSELLCVLHWGRQGGKGQVQVHRFGGPAPQLGDALKVFDAKYAEKARKYAVVQAPGVTTLPLSDTLMEQVAAGGVPVGGWEKNGWAVAVTDGVLVPARMQVDIAGFIQTLLGAQSVTPEMVVTRSGFTAQMDELRRAVAEAEAAAELMDTVYRKRLS